jgi:hypothetical protein
MSEYQYYEFAAVDKPLNEKDMRTLRNLSSRAQITPSSFVNEYNWGNFKGNPLKLMEKYFESIWKKVDELIVWKQAAKYDEAVELLVDLRDLYKKTRTEKAFKQKLKRICENHRRKVNFLNRLQKAGLRG